MSHPRHNRSTALYSTGTLNLRYRYWVPSLFIPYTHRTSSMCLDREAKSRVRNLFAPQDEPPDWKNIDLPETAVLKLCEYLITGLTCNGPCTLSYFFGILVVDAHCHPTDLPFSDAQVRDVGLGGLSAMATRIHDQELVEGFGRQYGRSQGRKPETETDTATAAIACFGELAPVLHHT